MRSTPPALLAHLQLPVTSTCRLLRITLKDGRAFGLTTLDRDVIYQGVTYHAATGFDPSIIATDAGLSVDNAEAYALLAGDVPGITIEMVACGELDDAQWTMLLVNWRDLSMGHMVLDAGDVGEVNTVDGQLYMPELLSYAMRLRQPIGGYWSRNCRAIFGTPANSQTGCGVGADPLWVAGTITEVDDSDPARVFASAGLGFGYVNTGRVRFISGANAGQRLYQVEAFGPLTGTVVLAEAAPFPLTDGVTFEIRVDCDKTPDRCKSFANWPHGYKGEPNIPVGDGVEMLTPNAQISGGFGGSEVIE